MALFPHARSLICVATAVGSLTFAACNQDPSHSGNKDSADATAQKKTDVAASDKTKTTTDSGKGGFRLTMPQQFAARPYATLRIEVEGNGCYVCAYDTAPSASSVASNAPAHADSEVHTDSAVAYGLNHRGHGRFHHDGIDGDAKPWKGDWRDDDECESFHSVSDFAYADGQVVSLDGLPVGYVDVTVSLLDENDQVLETGSGGVDVVANKVSNLEIELHKAEDETGSVNVIITRRGDPEVWPIEPPVPCHPVALTGGGVQPGSGQLLGGLLARCYPPKLTPATEPRPPKYLTGKCYRIENSGFYDNGEGSSCAVLPENLSLICGGYNLSNFKTLPSRPNHMGNTLNGPC